MRGQELLTFVVYDIESDKLRTKVANACKDYGLDRVQYSTFCGLLDASRRKELFARLSDTLGREPGKILVLPLCEKDAGARRVVVNAPANAPRAAPADAPAGGAAREG